MEDLDELIETYYTARHTLSEKDIRLFEQLYATNEEFKKKTIAQKLLIRAIRMEYAEEFLNKQKKQRRQLQLITGLAASIILLLGLGYFAYINDNSTEERVLTQTTPIKNTKDSLPTSTKKIDTTIKKLSSPKPELLTFQIKEEEQMGYTPSSKATIYIQYLKSNTVKIEKKSETVYYLSSNKKPESIVKYKNKLYFKINHVYYNDIMENVTDRYLLEQLEFIDF